MCVHVHVEVRRWWVSFLYIPLSCVCACVYVWALPKYKCPWRPEKGTRSPGTTQWECSTACMCLYVYACVAGPEQATRAPPTAVTDSGELHVGARLKPRFPARATGGLNCWALSGPSFIFWNRFLTLPKAHWSSLLGLAFTPLRSSGVADTTFDVNSGNSNSGPHACWVGNLPIEPSPHTEVKFSSNLTTL